MRVSVQVSGLRELNDALAALPKAVGKRVLDGALKSGGKLIEAAAERLAPVLQVPDRRRRPGTVRRALATTARRRTEGHAALVVVKPKRLKAAAVRAFKARTGLAGAANPDDPFYWWFLEYGWHDAKGRFHRRPFLRPAFEAQKHAALAKIKAQLGSRIRGAWLRQRLRGVTYAG